MLKLICLDIDNFKAFIRLSERSRPLVRCEFASLAPENPCVEGRILEINHANHSICPTVRSTLEEYVVVHFWPLTEQPFLHWEWELYFQNS